MTSHHAFYSSANIDIRLLLKHAFACIYFHRDVNQAVDYVFSNNVSLDQGSGGSGSAATGSGNCNKVKAQALFDGYKSTNDMGEVVMDQDGINAFMTQCGVDAETDVLFIKISQYMEAAFMGEYTSEEFNKGSTALGCDSIASWTAILPRLR